MVSRMERYYKTERNAAERTKKNVELYRAIYDDAEYSNIEGVTTIEKSNEIDIRKIKEMLQNREEYQKRKDLPTTMRPVIEEPKIEYFEAKEEHNYDIRDILSKAKDERVEDDKNRSLRNTQYDILKNINIREIFDKKEYQEEDEQLKELIHTITNTSVVNKMGDKELSLDLLGDLKSSGNTIVETNSAITQLLKEAKKESEKEEKDDMDKSFFTSSLNFGEDDFEELKDIHTSIKKNNGLMKILLIILGLVMIGIIGFLVYTFLIK